METIKKHLFFKNMIANLIVFIFLNFPVLIFGENVDANSFDKEKPKTQRPNILFILVDTLRADHLGCYGYKKNTSPNIDEVANKGILFKEVYSVSSWTNPTIATLFTGFYPQAVFEPVKWREAIQQVLPDELNTLAEILRDSGYHTIALVDHPGIVEELNYNQGFEKFITLYKKAGVFAYSTKDTSSGFIIDELCDNLEMVKNSSYFVYLHLVFPHRPYSPISPYDKVFGKGYKEITESEKQGVINMYDGEVRYTDDFIKNLFAKLQSKRLIKDTYIVITSDHGEGFWEHGLSEHGNSLYNELLRIPLIIYPPEDRLIKTIQISAPVSNIDLFPTILEMAGIKKSKSVEGESLFRYLDKDFVPDKNKLLFSESSHSKCIHALSCTDGKIKAIYDSQGLESDKDQFFDLKGDLFEQNNLAAGNRLYKEMKKKLRHHKRINGIKRKQIQQENTEINAESMKRLRSLGYLN